MTYSATLTLCALLIVASSTQLQAKNGAECPIRMARSPAPAGVGRVVRFLSQEEIAAALSKSQALAGRQIDGAYLNNVRAELVLNDGSSKTIVVPDDMSLQVGDRVAFQSSYVTSLPSCSYVPTLATRKLSSEH